MVEHSRPVSLVLDAVRDELPKRLQPYNRTTPQQRSHEMQRAAFSEARRVTDAEYKELIGIVRLIREWLKQKGEHEEETPEHAEKPTPYLKEDSGESYRHMVEVILKPWEQSAGYSREPYRKFGFELEDEDMKVSFSLNFNDTYDLIVKLKDAPQKYEIEQFNRKNMRRPEHDFVMECINQISTHFGIPLQ